MHRRTSCSTKVHWDAVQCFPLRKNTYMQHFLLSTQHRTRERGLCFLYALVLNLHWSLQINQLNGLGVSEQKKKKMYCRQCTEAPAQIPSDCEAENKPASFVQISEDLRFGELINASFMSEHYDIKFTDNNYQPAAASPCGVTGENAELHGCRIL